LAAVTPFAIESKKKAWKVGVFWGLGHLLGMSLIGVLFLLFEEIIPIEKISNYSEQLVGFVIIFIGLWAFYQIFNKKIDTSICTSTVMICLFFIPMLTNIRQTTDIRIPTKIK